MTKSCPRCGGMAHILCCLDINDPTARALRRVNNRTDLLLQALEGLTIRVEKLMERVDALEKLVEGDK